MMAALKASATRLLSEKTGNAYLKASAFWRSFDASRLRDERDEVHALLGRTLCAVQGAY